VESSLDPDLYLFRHEEEFWIDINFITPEFLTEFIPFIQRLLTFIPAELKEQLSSELRNLPPHRINPRVFTLTHCEVVQTNINYLAQIHREVEFRLYPELVIVVIRETELLAPISESVIRCLGY
jgi:hypothetical protein